MAYALLANDGGLIVPPNTTTQSLFKVAGAFLNLMTRDRNFTVRNRDEVYSLPYRKVGEFVAHILRCAFPDTLLSQIDGDVVKHTVSHYKVILL